MPPKRDETSASSSDSDSAAPSITSTSDSEVFVAIMQFGGLNFSGRNDKYRDCKISKVVNTLVGLF